MNKAVIVACMGLLVVAGCSKDKKSVSSDAGMNPPPPPTMVSQDPVPLPPAPLPPEPIAAPQPAPVKPVHVSAPARTHATPVKVESSTKGKKHYVVQKGDSLSKIAKHYKTTVSKLMKANPKIKPDGKILIGQKITIP